MKSLLSVLILLQAANAFAESKIVITPVSQKVQLKATRANAAGPIEAQEDYILTAQRSLVTTETITSVEYSCEDVDTNSDGRQGNWNGFYEAPQEKKAAALNKSIQGVGDRTAPLLVGYFIKGKPRSWKAFSKLIQTAAKDLTAKGIPSGWASQVLYTHKEENMRNLGYLSSSVDCQATVKTYKIENTEKMGEVNALVKLKARNIKLLLNEAENFEITYDGKRVSINANESFNQMASRISYSDYGNRYDTSASIEIIGLNRKAVTPGNLIESNRSKIAADGTLVISHQGLSALAINREFAAKCKAIVSASVIGTEGSFWNSKDRTLMTRDIELDLSQGQTVAAFGNTGKSAKEDLSVSYDLRFAPGCPYFNTKPTLKSLIGD
jgi:hypothetical protein